MKDYWTLVFALQVGVQRNTNINSMSLLLTHNGTCHVFVPERGLALWPRSALWLIDYFLQDINYLFLMNET